MVKIICEGKSDDFLDCINFEEKNHHKYIMEQLHKITSPEKPYDLNHQNFKVLKDELTTLFFGD